MNLLSHADVEKALGATFGRDDSVALDTLLIPLVEGEGRTAINRDLVASVAGEEHVLEPGVDAISFKQTPILAVTSVNIEGVEIVEFDETDTTGSLWGSFVVELWGIRFVSLGDLWTPPIPYEGWQFPLHVTVAYTVQALSEAYANAFRSICLARILRNWSQRETRKAIREAQLAGVTSLTIEGYSVSIDTTSDVIKGGRGAVITGFAPDEKESLQRLRRRVIR